VISQEGRSCTELVVIFQNSLFNLRLALTLMDHKSLLSSHREVLKFRNVRKSSNCYLFSFHFTRIPV
jgi:hypothetical protein